MGGMLNVFSVGGARDFSSVCRLSSSSSSSSCLKANKEEKEKEERERKNEIITGSKQAAARV